MVHKSTRSLEINYEDDTFNKTTALFDTTFDSIDLIAISGNSGKTTVVNMLSMIFGSHNYTKSRIPALNTAIKGNEVESLRDYLNSFLRDGIRTIPVKIDSDPRKQNRLNNLSFDCGILTNIGISSDMEVNLDSINLLGEFFSRIPPNKPILLNIDEPFILKAVEGNKGIIPLSYGLNKKAVATASSIDASDTTSFTFCLQRAIITKSNKMVEPFEIPITLKLPGGHNIYNALAAITCGLYYDVSPERIKQALEAYIGSVRRFQKVYEGVFTVVDDCCNSPLDYKAAFESLNTIKYKELYIIASINSNEDRSTNAENLKAMSDWAKLSNAREIVLTGCLDNQSIDKIPIRGVNAFRRLIKDKNIPYRYFDALSDAVEFSINRIGQEDLLLMLGGIEMDHSSRTVARAIDNKFRENPESKGLLN